MEENFINILVSFILDNYTNPDFQLENILEGVTGNKDHIYYVCHLAFGMSVMELVETIRLHEALNIMFLGENKTWMKVGYKSASVFSRAFKKRMGMKASKIIYQISGNNILHNEELHNKLREILWKGNYRHYKDIKIKILINK